MANIRGVILDVDGTLIDSNDAHAHSWVEALADNGINVPFEKVRELIGMGGDKLLPTLTKIEEDMPEGKQIGQRRKEIFKQKYLPELKAFPEAKALVERMREHGLKPVVASSAKKDELSALLAVVGVENLLEGTTSSSEVENSKPDPDIVQAALDKIGCTAAQVVMLGDTPYDVEAAAKAGVRTIALRCGGWNDQKLKGAAAIYNDPADLLSQYESSLLMQ